MGRFALSSHGTWPTVEASTRASKTVRVDELAVMESASNRRRARPGLSTTLIHRGHKPGNIFVRLRQRTELVISGGAECRARSRNFHLTGRHPYYVAPEKFKREPETFLSDMYSSRTLYHCDDRHVRLLAEVEEVHRRARCNAVDGTNRVVPT